MKIRLLLLIATTLVAGCSTVKAPTATFNSLNRPERNFVATPQDLVALDADFQRAIEICDTQMQSLREYFDGSGKRELTLASIGIVAGSIIVPTLAAKTSAAKSAIAGWGGVSGAANAAQYTLQQKGTSASKIGAVYESTRTDIRTALQEYSEAGDNIQKRLSAINKLYVTCRYPSLPNVETYTLPPADAPNATE